MEEPPEGLQGDLVRGELREHGEGQAGGQDVGEEVEARAWAFPV